MNLPQTLVYESLVSSLCLLLDSQKILYNVLGFAWMSLHDLK